MADEMTARDTGTFERVPEGGHHAVCADVVDLGFHYDAKFNKVAQKCALVFQTAEKSKTGKRYEISSRFTFNFGEKSNLRKFLSQWRGKSYSEEEAKAGAPLHKLEGVNAYITVEHKAVGDKTYANIISIIKAPPGYPTLEPENYTRSDHWKKGSEAEARNKAAQAAPPEVPSSNGHSPEFEDFPAALEEDDSDLPF